MARGRTAELTRTQTATRANGDQTRARILDAAEVLFGERGFAAVSLRDITTRADVTLALASYHFGTKEKLFEAVVERRAELLGNERRQRLAALVKKDVRSVLDAFMAPLFDKATASDPGWSDYFRVLARLGEGDQWLHVLHRYFDDTAQLFVAALCEALPKADPKDVTRAFTMVLHAMLSTVSQHKRVDNLTSGQVKGTDLASAYPVLLQFATSGMESFNR